MQFVHQASSRIIMLMGLWINGINDLIFVLILQLVICDILRGYLIFIHMNKIWS